MIKGNEHFSIGDRIELIKISSGDKRPYPSQILDIIDEKNYIVSGPIYKNQIVLMRKDEIIGVSYIVENKGKYYFNAKLLRRELEKVYKLKIKKISDTKRYQLREYYRFDIDIPVIKEFVFKKGNEKRTITERCRTKDISGGGLRLYSNYKHEVGDIILCKFNIDNHAIISKGKVMRIEKVDTFEYAYALGIKFIKLKDRDRDKIIQFIFLKQRLLREKGLI